MDEPCPAGLDNVCGRGGLEQLRRARPALPAELAEGYPVAAGLHVHGGRYGGTSKGRGVG